MTDLAPTATRLAADAERMRAQWAEEDRTAAAADLLVAEHGDTLDALGEGETRARDYQSGGPIANLPMGEPERPIFRTCACGADSGKLKICVDCQRRGYDEFNANAGKGHPGYLTLLGEIRALHLVKSGGYGTGKDPFANFTQVASASGEQRYLYPILRTIEKLTRCLSLHTQGRTGELEEEFKDGASLLLCAAAMLREDSVKDD